jgi:hypothetical protein
MGWWGSVRFISPDLGLGWVGANVQLIHELAKFCCVENTKSRVRLGEAKLQLYHGLMDEFTKRFRGQRYENTPFSFRDVTDGDVKIRGGVEHAGSFRDVTYGDVKNIESMVRGRIVWGCIVQGINMRGLNIRGTIILL